jgi:hypothetical protein
MEKLVRILEDYGFSEREYEGDKYASRGFLLTDGLDTFYGEMVGDNARREQSQTYDPAQIHIVQGYWKNVERQTQDGRKYWSNSFVISKLK